MNVQVMSESILGVQIVEENRRVPVIGGDSLPDMPWQERTPGDKSPLWRYRGNPIIKRDALPDSNSIFNSAAVPFRGGFAGVFRCDNTRRVPWLHVGFSQDGIHWNIEPRPHPLYRRTGGSRV